MIGPNLAATAYHVVANALSLDVVGPNRQRATNVKVAAVDPDNDIAILRLDAGRRGTFVLAASATAAGKEMRVVGHPRGMTQQDISARITSSADTISSLTLSGADGRRIFRHDIPVIPLNMTLYGGMSGAPVINGRGEVVGVLSGSLNEGGAIAWAIPSDRLSELLAVVTAGTAVAEFAWPRLTLMSEAWRASVRSYSINQISLSMPQRFLLGLRQLERTDTELGTSFLVDGLSNICLDVTSAVATIEMMGSSSADVNDLIGKSFTISLDRSNAQRLVQALARRFSQASSLREMTSSFSSLARSAITNQETLAEYNDAAQQLYIQFPELSVSSLDVVVGANTSEIESVTASALSLPRFSSLSSASDFGRRCNSAVNQIRKYVNDTNNERQFFHAQLRLIRRFEPDVSYVRAP